MKRAEIRARMVAQLRNVHERRAEAVARALRLGGAPSVLFDAVALLPSEVQAPSLGEAPAARDFASDAWAHAKLIAYVEAARPLLEETGLVDRLDGGCFPLGQDGVGRFLEACRRLRHWEREGAAT